MTKKILKDDLYYAPMFSQDISPRFIVYSSILAVQSHNSILKIFKVKLADGASLLICWAGAATIWKLPLLVGIIITIIIINRMGLSKDLWIYGQNTQIPKYIVGGTQKPL